MAYARHLSLATLDFLIGDPGKLDREDAMLALCAAMTSDGHVKESTNIFTFVLGLGIDPNKVRMVIEQAQLFCGFPRMLNALFALREAAEKAEVSLDGGEIHKLATTSESDLSDQGRELWNKVYGENAERVLEKTQAASAEAARWSLAHAYGRVMGRDGLGELQRELCVVAGLIPMDVQPQLKGHVMGAVNLGASKTQMWDLLSLVRKLFDADKLLDQTQKTFESAIGKKPGGLDIEEERKYTW